MFNLTRTKVGLRPALKQCQVLRLKGRWIAWWYIAIGIGFVLLAIVNIIARGKTWLIALRFIIAAGFMFLGWTELRLKRPKH